MTDNRLNELADRLDLMQSRPATESRTPTQPASNPDWLSPAAHSRLAALWHNMNTRRQATSRQRDASSHVEESSAPEIWQERVAETLTTPYMIPADAKCPTRNS